MQESTRKSTFAIGLTGGIGAGKTTVSDLFLELGSEIIDADEIARALVAKGSPLLEKIREQFGDDVIGPHGNLDRTSLRNRVFQDEEARSWLEDLLHPAIRTEISDRITHSHSAYVIVVIPLLVESGSYDFLDRIAVVDTPEEQQVKRVVSRDGSAQELVTKILEAQASRQQRLERADDILDNSGSLENLKRKVRALHEKYLGLAQG